MMSDDNSFNELQKVLEQYKKLANPVFDNAIDITNIKKSTKLMNNYTNPFTASNDWYKYNPIQRKLNIDNQLKKQLLLKNNIASNSLNNLKNQLTINPPLQNVISPSIYRTINNIKTKSNLMNILSESFNIVQNIRNKFPLTYTIPLYIRSIFRLTDNDWVIPHEKIHDDIFHHQILEMSDSKIDEFMQNYFAKNNFRKLNRLFDLIINNLRKLNNPKKIGFINMIKKIKKLFKLSPDSYMVLVPNLFSLLEFINLQTTYFKAFKKNNKKKQIINYKYFESNLSTYYIINYNLFCIGADFYKSFNNADNQTLNRNLIQHGKYDPSNIKLNDFIKLVLLCNGFLFNVIKNK
jgi:hypothetical protein